eukprot:2832559-Alexandrium_andersonii.AAC.1
MSASLVGSEMCIRDRNPRQLRVKRGSAVSHVHQRKGQGDATAPDPTAVSYTHLTLPTICSV